MCYGRSNEEYMEHDVEQPELIEEKHTTILRVENVSKAYGIPDGRLRVLQNVRLQVVYRDYRPIWFWEDHLALLVRCIG